MQRVRSSLLVVAVVVAVALFAFGTQHARAQDDRFVWGLVSGVVPSTANLTGVFMMDTDNAWVVGSDGAGGKAYRLLHYAQDNWRPVETTSLPSPVLAIAAVSDFNVWAVGESGLVAHKDANGWRTLVSPVPAARLTTVQMFGAGTEGWAAGYVPSSPQSNTGTPIMLHYTNGAWIQDTSIALRPNGFQAVNSLHFANGGGYAVGADQAWRYDGGRWVEEQLPPLPQGYHGCYYTLNGVRAISRDEAWATGYKLCGGPANGGYQVALHRTRDGWQEILSRQEVADDPLGGRRWGQLSGVSFAGNGLGLSVGGQQKDLAFIPPVAYVLSYRPDGRWHYENTPDVQTILRSVSQVDDTHALAVGTNGVILSYGYGLGAPVPSPTPTVTPVPFPTTLPSARISDPRNSTLTYFPVVGHTLAGGFRDYWTAHGGLEQFGYPITEEFIEVSPTDGKPYVTQYFERARFEWHPDNRPPYDVLLGLLGHTITQGREREEPFRPAQARSEPGYTYFQPTEHNLAPEFAQYWQTHGGLPVYGYPISESFTEVSPTDGKPYLVQYFERNRLEYHPELPPAYRVSLGLLGVQVLKDRGWIE